ncbi:phospholipid carrier-dependent glycosyltransferase [Paenibacillus protaetiae]|uniref:Phospholipid carrier-dependent glycosyltransferase n=1 Tax=Paenibacillus protaetiae TaxID=2509456 RepID=A0A4P6FA85_9BACL|nr:phospholipid carrier-dependent glycosyltransferase [Paenibacillus protaetiae]QAY67408.1 phospholipid carrier-dependent glycosyltransferase [Paenibacillus protaetiae]
MLKQSIRFGAAAFIFIAVIVLALPLTAHAATVFPPFITAATAAATAAQEGHIPEKVSALPDLAFSAFYGLIFLYFYNRLIRRQTPLSLQPEQARGGRNTLYALAAGFILAFAVRLWIGASNPGYVNDLKTFMFWAQRASDGGLSHFYEKGMFADYPPGYIYVLYVLGTIQHWLGLADTSIGARVLYKFPAILADLISGLLLYRLGARRIGRTAAFGLAMLYIWNPAVIADSAAWGQVDSVFAFVLVLSLFGIARGRLTAGTVWFAIAALVKPQAFIFTPVLLLTYWHSRSGKRAAAAVLSGFAAFLLLAAPFFWSNGGVRGLIDLYTSTLSSYPYATLNAFNLYMLTGGNWAQLADSWLYMPYEAWGKIGIVLAVAFAAMYSLRRKKSGEDGLAPSLYIAIVLIAAVFVLVTKMHERYLFPVILLCAAAFIQSKDRRMLYLLFGFSITQFVNINYVLAFSHINSHPTADGIAILCSITNLCLLAYLLYVGFELYIRRRTQPVKPYTNEDASRAEEMRLAELYASPGEAAAVKKTNRLKRRDWLWMGGITAVYAIVAFIQLGSHQGPVTDWKPEMSGQSFYVDFGESEPLDSFVAFGGVGSGKYKLEFSDSPDQWGHPVEVDHTSSSVFKWNKQKLVDVDARYAKLTVESAGFTLHELAFYASGSDTPLPIVTINADDAASAERGSVQALFDEQNLATNKPSFMNGAYFDEIYHARTAYEFLHGMNAYENTHPPLGKLLIAVGIKIFGLNTFGWRVVGTVFGIGMLPIMYVFALRLFRRTGYAAIATGLFAVDFMHFTQTRIATIDVYGVFFIMLMFYFMHRYRDTDFYKLPLRSAIWPLFWSGLFFGIGAASKWIVLYGGAGLAVVLFMTLYSRYRQYAAAKKTLAASGGMFVERIEGEEGLLRHVVREFPVAPFGRWLAASCFSWLFRQRSMRRRLSRCLTPSRPAIRLKVL